MFGQISWKPSVLASAFRVIQCLLEGRSLRDEPLALLFEPLVDRFRRTDIPPNAFEYLVPLSVQISNTNQLAGLVITELENSTRISFRHQHLEQLIRECEQAMIDLHPNLSEELRVRVRPIREQWEARGPGLLAAVQRLTECKLDDLCPDVILTHPILGGGGLSFPSQNALCLEAVLANRYFELPEILRIGWLYSQLGFESDLEPTVLRLGLLPIVLAAGEEVEACRVDLRTIQLALKNWHIESPRNTDAATILLKWWDQTDHGTNWANSLLQLEQMF